MSLYAERVPHLRAVLAQLSTVGTQLEHAGRGLTSAQHELSQRSTWQGLSAAEASAAAGRLAVLDTRLVGFVQQAQAIVAQLVADLERVGAEREHAVTDALRQALHLQDGHVSVPRVLLLAAERAALDLLVDPWGEVHRLQGLAERINARIAAADGEMARLDAVAARALEDLAVPVHDASARPGRALVLELLGTPVFLYAVSNHLELVTGRDVGEAMAVLRTLTRPADVRAYLSSLSDEERSALVDADPSCIGNLEGAPLDMRFAANRLSMAAEVDRLRRSGSADDRKKADSLDRMLHEHRLEFLLFDPSGDGRVAAVIGDLAHADNVAVMVPGITTTLASFEGMAHDGEHLQSVASADGQRTAVIAWLGYDTPGLDATALSDGMARKGAQQLQATFDGLLLPPGTRTSVVAHSYGTLVTSVALRGGLHVDNVVVIGSPGMQVADVGGLHLPPGTHFYAGRADADYVSRSSYYGPDPAGPDFGSTRFDTGAAEGHSEYYDGGAGDTSTYNIAHIVDGEYASVTLHHNTALESVQDLNDRVDHALRSAQPPNPVTDKVLTVAHGIGNVVLDEVPHLPEHLADAGRGVERWTGDRVHDVSTWGTHRVEDVQQGAREVRDWAGDRVDGVTQGAQSAEGWARDRVDGVTEFWGW